TGATPPRVEIEMPSTFHAESEGLDLLDMRGGTLHWLWSPAVADPTYGTGHTELLTFVPAAEAKLHLTIKRKGKNATAKVTHRFAGNNRAVAGAQVTLGSRKATTNASGVATFKKAAKRKLKAKASKLDLTPATATLAKAK